MKSLYERILDLRDRISLDGDDTIYEEDYLLLDEVLDLIENSGGWYMDIEAQIYDYNITEDIYNELEIGIKFKKQEKLLKLYQRLYKDFDDITLSEIILIKNKIKELENDIR